MGRFRVNKQAYLEERGNQNALRIFFCKLCGFLCQWVFDNRLRVSLCRAMGIKIGKGVFIGKYCIIDDTFPELITIEDAANISFGVTIIAHDASKDEVAPVIIRKGVFLGARSVILPGVEIGEESVVGAGSVVTRDVPPNSIARGVPAYVVDKADNDQ